ncbi:MAG: DEAD/DEAH box helicase [Candidatus Odinarchaeia archaeon]
MERYCESPENADNAGKVNVKEKENLLIVCTPMSCWELVRELSLRNSSDKKRKIIYLLPFRSLAEKMFAELSRKNNLGLKISIISNNNRGNFEDEDVIISTYSDFLSLMLGLEKKPYFHCELTIAIDYLHLIGEEEFTWLIEALILAIRFKLQNVQLIGLLSGASNVPKLAEWLNAHLIDYTSRKQLRYTISEVSNKDNEILTIIKTVKEVERIVIFLDGASEIEKLTEKILEHLHLKEEKSVAKSFHQVLREIPELNTVEQLNALLFHAMKSGVAFYHRELSSQEKNVVTRFLAKGYAKIALVDLYTCLETPLNPTEYVVFREFYVKSKKGTLVILKELSANVLHSILASLGINNNSITHVKFLVKNSQEAEAITERYFRVNPKGWLYPRYNDVKSTFSNRAKMLDFLLLVLSIFNRINPQRLALLVKNTFCLFINPEDRHILNSLQVSKEIKPVLKECSTYSDLMKANAIPDLNVKILEISHERIVGEIKSIQRDVRYKTLFNAHGSVSCTCEYWRFRGRFKNRLCKHLIKLALYVEKINPKSIHVILKALNKFSAIDELIKEGLAQMRGESLEITEKGLKKAMNILEFTNS